MQKERLQDEFTSALNMFQTVQRSTASKEKEQVNKAKAQAYGGEPFICKLIFVDIKIHLLCLIMEFYHFMV